MRSSSRQSCRVMAMWMASAVPVHVMGFEMGWFTTCVVCLAAVGLLALVLRRDDCPICMNRVLTLRMHPASSACGHRSCAPCWRRFFSSQDRSLIDALRRQRSSSALCCWGCDAVLDAGVVRKFASRDLRTVAAQVATREEYEQRAERLNFLCVDCPECSIGLGYDDGRQRTIMCFLCQHQWAVERGFDWGGALAGLVGAWWPLRPAGLAGTRPCPHCGANIQKDGGCPMMCAAHQPSLAAPAHPRCVAPLSARRHPRARQAMRHVQQTLPMGLLQQQHRLCDRRALPSAPPPAPWSIAASGSASARARALVLVRARVGEHCSWPQLAGRASDPGLQGP